MDRITLNHGNGGRESHRLITELFTRKFEMKEPLTDAAVLPARGEQLAFTTDSYVVDPVFFPGGDIGELAIYGTVNDISMCGGSPLYLSAGLVIEEGFLISDLEKIIKSMGSAAKKAGVKVVTGDTKVVPKGVADKIFINTSGIGLIPENVDVGCEKAVPGDKIILSGTIADHGIAILTQREGMSFKSSIISDTAPLNQMVEKIFSSSGNVHVLRDPTRGGVGTSLNEIAEKSNSGIRIYENKIPVKNEVRGICELLGFDPLYIANEGKLLAFVSPEDADKVLAAVRGDELGRDACIIGEVVSGHPGKVFLETGIGGTRMVDMLTGEQLPRIC